MDASERPVDPAAGGMRVPYLLHSLAEFEALICAAFDVAGVRSVAEIGGEDGFLTKKLLRWAGTGRSVSVIDPDPSATLVELERENANLQLISLKSIDGLDKLGEIDAFLVDGDHNYFTVSTELRMIEERSKAPGFPLVFLHDVGWPCARRDQYYNPADIPAEQRHPYSYELGLVPGNPGLVKSGFRGEGQFAVATAEGGPGNGVLTAIEDFLDRREDLFFAVVPCIFGLGLLFPNDAPYAGALRQLLQSYAENPVLARLEENRLDLYVRLIELEDALKDRDGALQAGKEALERAHLQIRNLETENRALWRRHDDEAHRLALAEDQAARLRAILASVASSRSLRAAEAVSQLTRVAGRSEPLSRARLRQALQDLS